MKKLIQLIEKFDGPQSTLSNEFVLFLLLCHYFMDDYESIGLTTLFLHK